MCDGVIDCPFRDDEFFCSFFSQECLMYCTCLLKETEYQGHGTVMTSLYKEKGKYQFCRQGFLGPCQSSLP